jgi:Zn-dependent protease with chaperone function
VADSKWPKPEDMKWPALYDRKSGFIEIIDFKIVFSGEYGRTAEIPVNQLQIKIRGENSISYHLIDRYDTNVKFVIQNREPLEILARRGINEAKIALQRRGRRLSSQLLRYAAPVLFVIGGFFALPYILAVVPANWLDVAFPPSKERKLGELLLSTTQSQFDVDPGHRATKDVQALVDHLVKANPSLTEHSPTVFISRNSDVNAFATTGGFIICNRGLIEQAGSLEEIAGVLAHELGHVELRHVSRSILTSLGATGSLLLLSALVGGDVAAVIGQMSGLMQLKYSRSQEQKADDRGFTLLIKAKVSPGGLIKFFKRLEVLPNSPATANLTFLSTHPLTQERIEDLEAKLNPYAGAEWLPLPGSLESLRALSK